MKHILACIDGSQHTQSVCRLSAWAAEKTGNPVTLLHVVPAYSEAALYADLSGQIGLGAKTDLMDDLVKVDAERGKLEQKKGQIMLTQASAALTQLGATAHKTAHRRGTLVDTVTEMESDTSLIVIGKRGETSSATDHLGANFERVSRAVHTPVLVATKEAKPITRFLIAYDGSPNSKKALDFVCSGNLLSDTECHILTVGADTAENRATLNAAKTALSNAGFQVKASLASAPSIDNTVSTYVEDNQINLLVMGAYGHSTIRRMIFGSTTMAQIDRSTIPVLLFR